MDSPSGTYVMRPVSDFGYVCCGHAHRHHRLALVLVAGPWSTTLGVIGDARAVKPAEEKEIGDQGRTP